MAPSGNLFLISFRVSWYFIQLRCCPTGTDRPHSSFSYTWVQIAVAIGFLTYIVGALLYRFVKMRNEKEEVDHHYVQSRLRSLETQLNPHFLFNALNSIAELIHQDPDKAETAILKVSTFLRNTMDEKALIPLDDEAQKCA